MLTYLPHRRHHARHVRGAHHSAHTLFYTTIDLAAAQACEDAALDGVRYLEVRFSPILHVNEGASLSSVMEAVCGTHLTPRSPPHDLLCLAVLRWNLCPTRLRASF